MIADRGLQGIGCSSCQGQSLVLVLPFCRFTLFGSKITSNIAIILE
jgi:hypothetical protein